MWRYVQALAETPLPYQLVLDGVVREFEFYAPPHGIERVFAENRGTGLPQINL